MQKTDRFESQFFVGAGRVPHLTGTRPIRARRTSDPQNDANRSRRAHDRLAHARGHHRLRLPDLADRLRPALRLRLLSHTHVGSEWLGARRFRARLCAAEPALGHGSAVCRRGRGPLRHGAGAERRRAALCRRPRADGLHDVPGHPAGDGGRSDRLRPFGLLVQSRHRGVRQAAGRALPHDRDRRRDGGGIVRPVPVRAVRRRADRRRRLAAGAAGVRRHAAADRSAGARARDAALRAEAGRRRRSPRRSR